MTPATVVITQWVHASVIERLRPHARVILNQDRGTLPPMEVRRRCAGADAAIVFMSDHIDADFLAACPRLRLIAAALKGYDNIDLAACAQREVAVSIVPDLLTAPTAELAVGLLIGLGRHLRSGDALVRSGAFDGWRPILYGQGLEHSRIGIVGLGAVGRAIARRLAPFGCELLGHDPAGVLFDSVRTMALDELLASADAVILAAPLTPSSIALIDRQALERMRPGALLVNVGRGAVVDEAAVAAALAAERLGGYAADVFAFEDRSLPHAPNTIPPDLLEHERTLFTPHLGSAVDRVREQIALAAADNVLDLLAGRDPRDRLLPEVPLEDHSEIDSIFID